MKRVMLLASKDMCDILCHALEDTYITLPCSDPLAGIELLQTNPDILIVELSLPCANGMAFLREHANALPLVRIALTTFVSDQILAELAMLGVSSVVLLPFRVPYLISLI